MLRYFGFLTLLCLVISQTPLVISDVTNTIVLSPAGLNPIYQNVHTSMGQNYLGNAAQWIFTDDEYAAASNWPDLYTATFQTLFNAYCPQNPAVLKAAGDNQFTAYLNGDAVGTGNTWQNANSYTINNLKCGVNNLTVQGKNVGGVGPAAVIYSITQDNANCYDCGPQADYDFKTCQCVCKNIFYRNSDYQRSWVGYPTCRYQCVNRLTANCNSKKYFNNQDCNCQCLPQICLEDQDQDPSSCQCKCKKQQCPKGQVWNYADCNCQAKPCPLTRRCQDPKVWNSGECECVCPSPPRLCRDDEEWNSRTCQCSKCKDKIRN